MEFLDARRLTGPSLLFDGPAAILDVSCTVEEADRIERAWLAQVERMHVALGWSTPVFSRKTECRSKHLSTTTHFTYSDYNHGVYKRFKSVSRIEDDNMLFNVQQFNDRRTVL